MPVERVRLLYLPTGDEVRWEPEPEDIEQARLRLAGWIGRVDADTSFAPIPGPGCRACRFLTRCPAGAGAATAGPPATVTAGPVGTAVGANRWPIAAEGAFA
jgi:hypothetical protein